MPPVLTSFIAKISYIEDRHDLFLDKSWTKDLNQEKKCRLFVFLFEGLFYILLKELFLNIDGIFVISL